MTALPSGQVQGLSPALLALRDALTVMDERPAVFVVEVPVATVSEANARTHWRQRSGRAAKQRAAVALLVRALDPCCMGPAATLVSGQLVSGRGLVVRLTRVAPRPLDSDNLAGALKACRDGVADVLGVDDRDSRVVWVVDQRRGKAAVEVAVWGRHGR